MRINSALLITTATAENVRELESRFPLAAGEAAERSPLNDAGHFDPLRRLVHTLPRLRDTTINGYDQHRSGSLSDVA